MHKKKKTVNKISRENLPLISWMRLIILIHNLIYWQQSTTKQIFDQKLFIFNKESKREKWKKKHRNKDETEEIINKRQTILLYFF